MIPLFESLVAFLAILNPFALCPYLREIMADLALRQLLRVLAFACFISFLVFCVCAFLGEDILVRVIGVHPQALRAFGGVIFFVVGYEYVTKGYRATVQLRGPLEALPSAIALPFMIGAGTITQAILIGKRLPISSAVLALFLGVLVSLLVLALFKMAHDRMRGAREPRCLSSSSLHLEGGR